MIKPKIAIACQGGGSQTAFTAGALKALFESDVRERFDIVGLSGTSGGAICAFMIWYAMRKGDDPVWKRLIDLWTDNTAQTFQERLFNDSVIKTMELISKGHAPQYNISPASPLVKTWFASTTAGLRNRFTDFQALLEAHIDFREIASWGPQPAAPVVLLGACNILSGKLCKFSSAIDTLKVEHILASAAVPNIFPAVQIGEDAYWDGLFSDNPPIEALIKSRFVGPANIPDEIWVIKINPTSSGKIPVEADDVADRRNELEGNVSLFQSLNQIETLNNLFLRGAFKAEFLEQYDIQEPIRVPKSFPEDPDQPYHIPWIEMSAELARSLNYESKIDRSPANIARLIEDGEKQGKHFLEARLRQTF